MTTPAPSTPTNDPAARAEQAEQVDAALAARCTSSGTWIAGLIAAGLLDTVGRPHKLPEALFPDTDPDIVRAIWDAALPVGYRAGRYAAAPRFHRDTLTRLQHALADAGHHAMAGLVHQTVTTLPPPPTAAEHPADDDTARGEHW